MNRTDKIKRIRKLKEDREQMKIKKFIGLLSIETLTEIDDYYRNNPGTESMDYNDMGLSPTTITDIEKCYNLVFNN